MSRVAMAAASTGIMYLGYDYSTCHPMRKMDYDVKGAFIRLNNIVARNLGAKSFNLVELAKYDGSDGKPTYFSARGAVYDVSSSDMFKESYALWAGKDATVSLAKMSLEPEDANRLDWNTLSDDENKTIASWTHYFGEKYLIVGELEEFRKSIEDR